MAQGRVDRCTAPVVKALENSALREEQRGRAEALEIHSPVINFFFGDEEKKTGAEKGQKEWKHGIARETGFT
jgi:hypothetical protein